MPAPRRLNFRVIKKLSAKLRDGCTVESACAMISVTPRSYYKWRSRGKREIARMESEGEETPHKDEAIFVTLLQETSRAQAGANIHYDGVIKDAAENDWRAALAWKEKSPVSDWNILARKRNKAGGHVVENMLASSTIITPKARRLFSRRMATDPVASEAAAYLQGVLDAVIEECGDDEEGES